jgi:cytoskeletal protein RodZ
LDYFIDSSITGYQMSLTLGQKLRQAREDKGISVGEVAEQTRISPLYIESIDNDDYRALPGGIFNRGFVKSYAKYVGIDEQEALLDYAKLLNATEGNDVEEVKTYRPQVLTDDRMQSSMLPTVIIAAILLGLMTGGVLFLVRYLREPSAAATESLAANANTRAANTNSAIPSETPAQTASPTIDMATLKVEFKASEIVSLTSMVDDVTNISNVMPGSAKIFEPKKNLKLSYSSSRAAFAQLALNGRSITLPTGPTNPKRPAIIEFEINKDNLERIWNSGSISGDTAVSNPDANTGTTRTQSIAPHPQTPKPEASPVKTPAETRVGGAPRPANVKNSVSTRPANTPR